MESKIQKNNASIISIMSDSRFDWNHIKGFVNPGNRKTVLKVKSLSLCKCTVL